MSLNTTEYYNRDLSWLRFNHRVLQEAADRRNPLFERIKFLAIFSSNLDEFFRVRVSEIRQIKKLDKNFRKKLITKPNKLLKEIKKQVHLQQEVFGNIFNNQIIPELRDNDIRLINWTEFSTSQEKFVQMYLKENPVLEQTVITSELEYPQNNHFIENEQLYLISLTKENKLILVKLPDDRSRFVPLPMENGVHYITFIDDILKYNLSNLYGSDFYALKVSRDAELYIDDEYSGHLLTKIKESLKNRDVGQITRILLGKNIEAPLVHCIKKLLDVNETDIIKGGIYHNFKDFFGFPNPTENMLELENLPPKYQKELREVSSIFEAIRKKDRLFYFPYESFDDVVRLLEEAAHDYSVTKIKITLYRIHFDSAIAKALVSAAKNGKNIFVFIETKARFDEKNNMHWGKILEDHGAIVKYSYPGIKVHSKICYIERSEKEKTKAYAYIGTGNFNEKTSKIYTDFGLMTANNKLTSELLQVFRVLEGKIIIPKIKKLLVSPFTTRSKFESLVTSEIQNANDNKEAHIIMKLNSLQDKKMIDLLYKASNAGVKIRLLIRGVCCLVPGVKEQSENIYITSIVDRFLEHGRIYIFGNGGKEKMFIGSADWMTRNLDHRIEVITPIYDDEVFSKLRVAIQIQLEDNVKARIIDAEQKNEYVKSSGDVQGSQYLTYNKIV